jgi:hypothetical protein
MAAIHALGHPNSPAPRTAWEPPELAQGGGSTAPAVTAVPAALPPNAPSIPVLAQGTGSDLIVTWTAPAVDPAHGAATGFALRHSPAGVETWTVVQAVSNPYELSDLPSAAAVDVQLQATNASGLSMWSATATLITGVTSSLPATSPVLPGRPAAPVNCDAEPASVSTYSALPHIPLAVCILAAPPGCAPQRTPKSVRWDSCIGAARLNLTGRRPKLKMVRCSGWYSAR